MQRKHFLALLRANRHAIRHAVALQVMQGIVVEGVEREVGAVIVLRQQAVAEQDQRQRQHAGAADATEEIASRMCHAVCL